MPRFTNGQKIPLGQNKRYKKCSLSSFDSQTNFSNLENQAFGNVSFSQ